MTFGFVPPRSAMKLDTRRATLTAMLHHSTPRASSPVSRSVVVAVVTHLVMAGSACAPSVGTVPFDAVHKRRALELISVFENSTVELQYGYVENLGDGRGFTCGLGFTTGTGDAFDVVTRYSDAVPANALASFLPVLQQRARDASDSVTGLDGFPAAWAASADDARFRAVQDAVTDEQSYAPALVHVDGLSMHSALGLMIVFDTVWMHGDDVDDDGTPALLARASQRAKPPSAGAGETAFLAAFLDVRRADLLHPSDASTQQEWSQAVGRVDVLRDLLNADNLALDGPIHVAHGFDVTVP